LGGLDVAMFRAINRDMQNTVLDNLAATASNIGSMDIYIFIYAHFFIIVPVND